MLNSESLQQIDEIRKRYPTAQAALLPVLWIAQEQFGSISQETMKEVADLLKVPYGHVLGVVSFYTMYHPAPVGKHHLEVCTNISCMIRGSGKIISHLEKKLGIKVGETTKDGAWTLSEVECMGACGGAPMCAVGEEYHEHLTIEGIDRLIEERTSWNR